MFNIKLRDKIAIAAMAAMISKFPPMSDDDIPEGFIESIADGAYAYADAMLLERQK